MYVCTYVCRVTEQIHIFKTAHCENTLGGPKQ